MSVILHHTNVLPLCSREPLGFLASFFLLLAAGILYLSILLFYIEEQEAQLQGGVLNPDWECVISNMKGKAMGWLLSNATFVFMMPQLTL